MRIQRAVLRKIFRTKSVALRAVNVNWNDDGWNVKANSVRRMLKRIKDQPTPEMLAAYEALLKHGNTYKLSRAILNFSDFRENNHFIIK